MTGQEDEDPSAPGHERPGVPVGRPGDAREAAAVVAFLAQGLIRSSEAVDPGRTIAVRAGVLLWLTASATLLSLLLRHRSERIGELVAARQRLMTEALTAEERERRALAEALHDEAIQNLLSARQDLADAGGPSPEPALERADSALRTTVAQLREAIFRLHPSIREEAGLAETLRALGEQAARRGRFRVDVDVQDGRGHPHERLLVSAARELLANVAEHAGARNVSLRLFQDAHELVLAVSDDGRGFDARVARDRLAAGHIGLASQRARAESVGGRLGVTSRPGRGTTVEVRVPA
jgi:two-component system NarL family sensor kinase